MRIKIRNSAEAFSRTTGRYVSAFLLFSRLAVGDQKDGFAGITDSAVLELGPNRVLIFGGQQGLQDATGEYISAGIGSVPQLDGLLSASHISPPLAHVSPLSSMGWADKPLDAAMIDSPCKVAIVSLRLYGVV